MKAIKIQFGQVIRTALAACLIFPALVTPTAAMAGELDLTFGTNGVIKTSLSQEGMDRINAVAIQPDGKIIAAGTGQSVFFAALARYNADGTLDDTFGSGGLVGTFGPFGQGSTGPGGREWNAVSILPDGKIVTAGYVSTPCCSNDKANFAVARFNPDGSRDGSFGAGGVVITSVGDSDYAFGMSIQNDGKIVLAGQSVTARTFSNGFPVETNSFTLARYNPNGSLDASFDGDGILTTSFNSSSPSSARHILIQPDGKIIATGNGGGGIGIVRYSSDGSVDNSFGTAGKVFTTIGNGNWGRSAVIQPDGKIVASSNNFIARYNSDGSLDNSFGTGGKVQHDNGLIRSIILLPDNKIIAGGYNGMPSITWTLARYNPNGILDSNFGTGGYVKSAFNASNTSFSNGFPSIYSMALQSDGNLIAAGSITIVKNSPFGGPVIRESFGIARYSVAGVPDADNDGVGDSIDNCSVTPNSDQANFDGDTFGDSCDNDDDNDSVLDQNDAFRFNPNESVDTDSDNIGNNADTDDDNDGFSDTTEMADGSDPLNPVSTPEICDGADNDLNDGVDENFTDSDGDGMADCVDPDDDNDGAADAEDNCSLTFNPDQADFDLDGIGDTCDPQTGPPRNKEQCKNGGWMRFDAPRRFNNQGNCIQFVNTGM